MAELNDNQMAWLRSEVGQKVTVEDLQGIFDRLGSVRDVAIEVLRGRRARLLDSPLTTTVAGVASVNFAENVKALERRITALQRLDPDPTDTPGEPADGGGTVDEVEAYTLGRSRGR